MDSRLILFGLHELPGIGWKTILNCLNEEGTIQSDLDVFKESLSWQKIGRTKISRIREHLTTSFIEQRLELYEQAGIRFSTFFDQHYPSYLRHSSEPPWVLYYQGDPKFFQLPSIAIVGTRKPTLYGKRAAEQLGVSLSEAGFCIVSGLARGIDSCAHVGAIKGKGSTIAVLGCGIGTVYPPENRGLYARIVEKGLVISEFPHGTGVHAGLFPLRNRIIAGLSVATVVVEAADLSGSLITVDRALDESRDVYAIPGPITSPTSQGTHKLIQEGAQLLTGAAQIMEAYRHLLPKDTDDSMVEDKKQDELTVDEQHIYNILTVEPMSVDEILHKSETTFGHLHTILLSLCLKNKIGQLSGSAYVIL